MKKTIENLKDPDLLAEYNFSKGVRGLYAERFAGVKSDVVVLAPDVAEYFGDSRSVNETLRLIAKVAEKQTKKTAARTSASSGLKS
jgi:hypothetical protein